MTAPIVPDFILNLFKNEIKKINISILEKFCKEFTINFDEAKIKLKDSLNIDFDLVNNEKIKVVNKQKELPSEDRCIARLFRKKDMEVNQCSRKKKDCDFCKRHEKMNDENRLKYGTINDEIPEEISEKKLNKIKKKNII
jgi:ribosomal protein S17E